MTEEGHMEIGSTMSPEQPAISSLPVYEDHSQVTSRRIISSGNLGTAPLTFLDASGRASTGPDGKRVFRLSDFVCDINSFSEPVFLIATPKTSRPCHVTLTHELIGNPGEPGLFSDVEITAFTWTPDGTADPNIAFDWRCRVVSNPIVF
jgi:hypothetical protein